MPAPNTRFFRLTHTQWENTVQDLLYLPEPTGLSEDFRTDPATGGFLFDNNAQTLEVDQTLWQSYAGAAMQVAELVAADPSLLAAIVPPDAGDAGARTTQFITELGTRAYRRPLTQEEIDLHVTAFDAAAALYEGVDPFTAGVRMTIETMLQSPHFIYRIESSSEVAGELIPLNGYEVASRLSYLLWGSMPDDDLFAAAGDDALGDADALADQARRMLADPRAHAVIERFHYQALDVRKFENVAPSTTFFPDVPADLGALAVEESRRFIEDVVFTRDGGLADLLISNETFVNDDLAKLYGLDGSYGDEFVKAELDTNERRGWMTQIGFLASHSTTVNPDPIHRGVFVARRMACLAVAAPPDGVPPLPPPEGRSNRQTVAEHTEQPGSACVGCHSTIINPMGFPFENYAADGSYRTADGEFPVDASSTVVLDGNDVAVDDALDLSEALAASPSVHECYLKHWVEYAHGRPLAPEDLPFTQRLGVDSQEGALPVKELLVELVTSRAFRNRATQELP
ncbi:MAG: DUF1592 domain-containing protein [Deltaproteobacteria bacterium]|nr:DUF1592 domain-containing protein [Nannocystaceae bacterium]